MQRLTIRIDGLGSHVPEVRLLVDGVDLLAAGGTDRGNDPAHLLDTGALLPTDPPRRIAFYGCACGQFGCANVAGLVTRRGDTVEWADFHSITGAYHYALAEPEDQPDPLTTGDAHEYARRLRLPDLAFDTAEYLTTVRRAMEDRAWETRARAVVRHVREIRPAVWPWAVGDGDRVEVHGTRLTVPGGDPQQLAERLILLLDEGVDPRRIEHAGLWR